MEAFLPENESERLAVLREHRILDTPSEEEFDDLVRLAASVCGVPIAAVSLIDQDRQWFKSILGLPISETPRAAAFCAHTILHSDLLIVPDAQNDARFADNPLVTGDPHIRFYAGAPLLTDDGYALGSLCVIDRVARTLTPEQEATLSLLARQVASQLKAARRVAEREWLVSEKEQLISEKEALACEWERAEASRRKAESERLRLAAIVETCEDAIYSVTLDRRITSWNAGAERLYGYSAVEMTGELLEILVPADRRGEIGDILQAVCRGERIAPLETVRLTKSGAGVDVSLRASPISDADGCIAGMSLIARDITEQKRTASALEAEREFTHAMLESLQEGIVACDAAGTLTLFNRATRDLHGLPEQPLPPELWADHFDLYESDGLTPMRTRDIPLFRALQDEVVRDAEMVIAPKFGPARTLLASGRPIHGPGGKKLGAVVAMHDVTERRQAEQEMARMAAIIASSEDAILGATLDGTLVSWNGSAERLYGYAASEMIGRHVSFLVPEGECSPVPAVITCLLRGESIGPQEVIRRRRDGTEFHASLSFSPIRDRDGEMVGLSCITRDITARKMAEAALREAHEDLAESEERLRRLTDSAFEGIAVSQDGVLVDASPAFAAMFGYADLAELVGLVGMNLAAPESRAMAAQKIATCSEDPYEATLIRRDGSTFQAEMRGRMIHLGGRPARITAVRDITERKAMECSLKEGHLALQQSEARLAEAQRVARIGSWEYDIATGRITWSEELFRLFDRDPSEGEPSVELLMTLYHPDDLEMHAAITEKAMQDGMPYAFDIRIRQQYGMVRWVHAAGRGERDESGQVVRLFGTLMDIHERKLTEERFRVLFEESSDAHLLLGEGGTIDCNGAAVALLGCQDKSQVLSLHPAVMSPEFQPDGRLSREKKGEMDAVAYEQGFHRFEWVLKKAEGEEFPVEVTLTPVTLAGRPVLLSVIHDLTERKRAEEMIKDHAIVLEFQKQELERANAELEALATTDGLTGLKNHRAFQERLTEEISRAGRYGTPLSVVLLDVDCFKQYNDSHGHPTGDAVLRSVAQVLQSCARDTDTVARYGGEEFVLVLPQTDREGALIFAERLRAAVAGHSWPLRPVTASFGVTSLCSGDEGSAELIARADRALYQSKSAGRNRVTDDFDLLAADYPATETRGEAAKSDTAADAAGGDPATAVFISDLNGIFLQVNANACKLLGYTAAELVGTCGRDLIHPDDLDRQGWRMDDVAAGQVVVTERRVRRKDGTWLQAEMRTQQKADGQAECVLRAVTFGHRAEKARQEETWRRFSFMQDVLASVTEDRLTLCRSEADLPGLLPVSSAPLLLSAAGGLRELRHAAWEACHAAGLAEDRAHDMMTAVGEAGMNCIVHVGEGNGQISADLLSGRVQVRITDSGAGIPWENLPKAALKKGYSSAGTLGHGMKMMLQSVDRLFLLTGPTGTTVVIAIEKAGAEARL